jgi:SAM-dependent methyltransferase
MTNLAYYSHDRCEIRPFWRGLNPSKVLEIGCGTCELVKYFGSQVEYWGIEPCSEACKIARKNTYRIVNSTFDNAYPSLPRGYYDLVIVNDVIEHVIDHEKMLYRISSLLNSNGAIVGSVPNLRHISVLYNLLQKKQFKYAPAGIMDCTHLRWFTMRSLLETLTSCGYRVDKIKGINPSIPGPIYKRILYKTILKLIGSDTMYQQIAFTAFPTNT